MQSFNQTGRIIITCNKRLSPFLQQEIKELGFQYGQNFFNGRRVNRNFK